MINNNNNNNLPPRSPLPSSSILVITNNSADKTHHRQHSEIPLHPHYQNSQSSSRRQQNNKQNISVSTLQRNPRNSLSQKAHLLHVYSEPSSSSSKIVHQIDIAPAFFSKANPFKLIEQGQKWISASSLSSGGAQNNNIESSRTHHHHRRRSSSSSRDICRFVEEDSDRGDYPHHHHHHLEDEIETDDDEKTSQNNSGLWIRISSGWIQATSPRRVVCLPHSCYGSMFSPILELESKNNKEQQKGNPENTLRHQKKKYPQKLIGAELVRWRNRAKHPTSVPMYTSPNLSSQIVGELLPGESIVGTSRLQHQSAMMSTSHRSNHHHHTEVIDSLASTMNAQDVNNHARSMMTDHHDHNHSHQNTSSSSSSSSSKKRLVMTFVECLMPCRMLNVAVVKTKSSTRRNNKSSSSTTPQQQKQLVFLPVGNGRDESWLCPELFVPGICSIVASLPNAWRIIPDQFARPREITDLYHHRHRQTCSISGQTKEMTPKPKPDDQKKSSESLTRPKTDMKEGSDGDTDPDDTDDDGTATCLAFSRSRISPSLMRDFSPAVSVSSSSLPPPPPPPGLPPTRRASRNQVNHHHDPF